MVRSKVENGPYEVTGFLPQKAPSTPEKPSLVSPQGRDRGPQKDLWKSPKHKILLVVKQGSAVVSTCTSGGGGILILVKEEEEEEEDGAGGGEADGEGEVDGRRRRRRTKTNDEEG